MGLTTSYALTVMQAETCTFPPVLLPSAYPLCFYPLSSSKEYARVSLPEKFMEHSQLTLIVPAKNVLDYSTVQHP